jgi:hypothetical protein
LTLTELQQSTLVKFLSAMVQMELLMLMIGWNQKKEEK